MTIEQQIETAGNALLTRQGIKPFAQNTPFASVTFRTPGIANAMREQLALNSLCNASVFGNTLCTTFVSREMAAQFNRLVQNIKHEVLNADLARPFTPNWLSDHLTLQDHLLSYERQKDNLTQPMSEIVAQYETVSAYYAHDESEQCIAAQSRDESWESLVNKLGRFIAVRFDGINQAQATAYITTFAERIDELLAKHVSLDPFRAGKLLSPISDKLVQLQGDNAKTLQSYHAIEKVKKALAPSNELGQTTIDLLASFGETVLAEMGLRELRAPTYEDNAFTGPQFQLSTLYSLEESLTNHVFEQWSQYGKSAINTLSRSVGMYLYRYASERRYQAFECTVMTLSKTMDSQDFAQAFTDAQDRLLTVSLPFSD